jgi:enoyl-CoA hydratase
MMRPFVRTERRGEIAILHLDRPPVNAVDLDMGRQAGEALDQLLAAAPGAIVLTGAGACFSAGLDLKVVPLYGAAEQREMVGRANRLLTALYASPVPVVAAVNGHAIAAGFVIAVACDYRVGTAGPCKIGLTEARAGIPFPAAAMAIVQAELAPAAARMLTLVARNVDAARALALGVLDEVVPADAVLPRALAVAEDLASMPRDAWTRIKRQLRAPAIARLAEIAAGADPLLTSWLEPEATEASRAVLREKGRT